MKPFSYNPVPVDNLAETSLPFLPEWIWEGFLARGNITLLTSAWKAGKTTLLAGLLRSLGDGSAFLDHPSIRASAVVVSEELPLHWMARQRAIPLGPNVRLVSRPFIGRPSAGDWEDFVRAIEKDRDQHAIDLLVVDPLATFLPGRSDSVPATLLDMLLPLRRLAELGVAILILHHPRKEAAEEGSKARGSGALLGFVDVILELNRLSRLKTDACRRKLTILSRHPAPSESLVYEWTPNTAQFRKVADLPTANFLDNWQTLEAILTDRNADATHTELLADWPENQPPPSHRQLYRWLTRATEQKLVIRIGNGTKNRPYRFRLVRESSSELGPAEPHFSIDPSAAMSTKEKMATLDRIERILARTDPAAHIPRNARTK